VVNWLSKTAIVKPNATTAKPYILNGIKILTIDLPFRVNDLEAASFVNIIDKA